jgi:hypothetical protein
MAENNVIDETQRMATKYLTENMFCFLWYLQIAPFKYIQVNQNMIPQTCGSFPLTLWRHRFMLMSGKWELHTQITFTEHEN